MSRITRLTNKDVRGGKRRLVTSAIMRSLVYPIATVKSNPFYLQQDLIHSASLSFLY